MIEAGDLFHSPGLTKRGGEHRRAVAARGAAILAGLPDEEARAREAVREIDVAQRTRRRPA